MSSEQKGYFTELLPQVSELKRYFSETGLDSDRIFISEFRIQNLKIKFRIQNRQKRQNFQNSESEFRIWYCQLGLVKTSFLNNAYNITLRQIWPAAGDTCEIFIQNLLKEA